jgi:hypothetical protein
MHHNRFVHRLCCAVLSGVQDDQVRKVGLSRYSRVSRTAFGLNGKKRIAVLRAGGAILGEHLPASSGCGAKLSGCSLPVVHCLCGPALSVRESCGVSLLAGWYCWR